METLQLEEVRTLAAAQQAPCISIYMPTDHRTNDSGGNGIRFKNLLRQAEAQLAEQGLKERAIADLLAPAWHLHEDRLFWEYQSDGFACFISAEVFRTYRLPLPFQEFVLVNRRFHLKPLLELLSVDGPFFVLALSKKENRVLYCSRYGSRRLEVPDMPKSLAYTLRFDEHGKDQEFSESESASIGQRGPQTQVLFQGRGGEIDHSLNDVTRYLHEIDEALRPILRDEQAPLILACVAYEHGVYRGLSHFAHVTEDLISGNPERLSDEQLREQGWRIAEPLFARARQTAAGGLQQALANQLGSTDLSETIRAAHDGAVDNLFLKVGQAVYGQFDPVSREVMIHAGRQPGDEDLLDLAAEAVISAGGSVWALKPEDMPTPSALAATLRYPIAHPVV